MQIINILERELELLNALHRVMRHLQRLLVARNFTEVEQVVAQIQKLEKSIITCEQERIHEAHSFSESSQPLDPAMSGREFLKLLPYQQRPAAKELLQHMRQETIHIQMLSESIRRFSAQSSSALRAVFSELFPEERHYTRAGTHLESQQTALLCNESK